MLHRNTTIIAMFTVALAAAACQRDQSRDETPTAEVSRDVDRAAELQRERDEAIAALETRVAEMEREYAEARQKVVSGTRTATAGLREELNEDVTNVKQAVNELRSTTADNWWERHETAMKRTLADIEADVRRLAGKIPAAKPQDTAGTAGDQASTAPFTSRRDSFVSDVRARVDAMDQALKNVTANGARETELEDTRARLRKLSEDADRLRSADADDWWDVTRARVTDYVDRVEDSVERLDDDKK
jgi:hypothetical protein